MFRRRPIGHRPQLRGGRAEMLLNEAHRLMTAGDFIQAAAILERLAQGAVQRGIPRAPFLFIRSGQAYLEGGEKPKGFTLVKHGLTLLAEQDRWEEFYRVGHRVLEILEEKGFTGEKDRLAAWLKEILPDTSRQAAELKLEVEKKHPILPTACPNCGGSLDPAVVAWRDDVTAECLYCGSMVRSEA